MAKKKHHSEASEQAAEKPKSENSSHVEKAGTLKERRAERQKVEKVREPVFEKVEGE